MRRGIAQQEAGSILNSVVGTWSHAGFSVLSLQAFSGVKIVCSCRLQEYFVISSCGM